MTQVHFTQLYGLYRNFIMLILCSIFLIVFLIVFIFIIKMMKENSGASIILCKWFLPTVDCF
ncbi:hypothetical protein CTI32_14580 (plasmid) [Enterococcus faecium]|nr:hypothetical protein CTI32_14505 [Enterococcus faecium]AYA35564.1 hypothetical protein CTI32_14580 [Enterococcus faecium]